MPRQNHNLRIGIDIGGTFTDFVVFDPASRELSTFKLPSTPANPAEAVLNGLNRLGIGGDREEINLSHQPVTIIHGSTVATNALLERKGARTALVTTRGFKDVLQIGRQNRPDLYDLSSAPPEAIIPADLRFEVDERVDSRGNVLTAIQATQIDQLISSLTSRGGLSPIESIAVVFLFSFANPQHEEVVTQKLRAAGFFVSASHEILPEYREYERTSTTAINAYVTPVLDCYLANLKTSLSQNPGRRIALQIMQSNGGILSVAEARKAGVRCILSGPAGGVVGCQYVGQRVVESANRPIGQTTSHLRLLTFDMGGTSTDVSLIDGKPGITAESEVGGYPVRIPILDIHTIGAGGGSIAFVDAGGVLRVGPQSAGAEPGPACYGRAAGSASLPTGNGASTHSSPALHPPSDARFPSAVPTVTDANLLLGRIPPDHFLGGQMRLYPPLAQAAIEPLARQLGLTPTQTALGIIEIANAHMERALRVISVERGHDPRDFTLLSFGGAGGLHAADLARRLSIPQVLVPPLASTLSAFGMLAADVIKDYAQTVMLPGTTPFDEIDSKLAKISEVGHQQIEAEDFTTQDIRIEPFVDMRYRGQSYELTLPFSGDFAEEFHREHQRTYGYHRPGADLEIVNLRVRATGVVSPPEIAAQLIESADPSAAQLEVRRVVFTEGEQEIPFYRGESLKPGNHIPGPAVIVRNDTTILIPPGDQAKIDPFSNVFITIQAIH